MEKQNSKKIGLINGIVLLVITLCALFLANETQSNVALSSVVLLGIGSSFRFLALFKDISLAESKMKNLRCRLWIKLAATNHSLPELPKMPTPLVTQEGNLKSG